MKRKVKRHCDKKRHRRWGKKIQNNIQKKFSFLRSAINEKQPKKEKNTTYVSARKV